MISRIDHVSIAVRDFGKALHFFKNVLGAVPCSSMEGGSMKYLWHIFSLGDLTRLELMTPTGKGSFLDGFLEKKEGGVHHITLETPDIHKAIGVLEANGIPYFGYNEYPGGVWNEVFIHPRDAFGVLIQIAQFRPDDWLAEEVKLPRGKRWEIRKSSGGCSLTLAHPGGGRARFELTRDEATALAEELAKCE